MEKLAWQSLSARLGRAPTTAELSREVQNSKVEDRRRVLEMVINDKLAIQAAERDRITTTDNEVNTQINQLKAMMAQSLGRQPTDAEFAAAVKEETGLDLPAFRENVKRQVTAEKYMYAKKQNILTDIKEPTQAEISGIYNLRKSEFIRPDTIRFSMIQVPYGADASSKARAKELADRLAREIGASTSRFDEAVLKGQTPNSGYLAGDAGYLPLNLAGQQVAGQDFINAAFALKQGEVSKVIEGVPGYQIIKITETLPQKSLELDEVMDPISMITVRQFISGSLMQQRQQDAFMKASQELVQELRAGNSFQIMENNLNW
jgi:parvulin-like peptidyl-prolyl isomerase